MTTDDPVTVQPTQDQRAMWRQIATDAGDDPLVNTLHPDEVLALLDQLDQAEAELDSWMTRAYEAEKRAWREEARIRAVQDVLDSPIHLVGWDDPLVPADAIRRALESVPPPSA